MTEGLDIAFFGSSLLSAWWNGACTYYRGVISGLHALGHRVTFYEPDAFGRQQHLDMTEPAYARVVVYQPGDGRSVRRLVAGTAGADVVVKASGVGVGDRELEEAVAGLSGRGPVVVFWDVDAPATLGRLESGEEPALAQLLPEFDLVLTYGGGDPVARRYLALGAADCQVVYNGFDGSTHYPVPGVPRWRAGCSLLANRLPDREERVEEFFFRAAALLPDRRFVLGGNGWEGRKMPANVDWVGHVGTEDHNAFNCSATTVLNVTRQAMAANGWSPATRVFEAAGVGRCLISDYWPGTEDFLAPGREILVAHDGAEVAGHIEATSPAAAERIGAAARRRVLAEHTYARRAAQLDDLLRCRVARGAGNHDGKKGRPLDVSPA